MSGRPLEQFTLEKIKRKILPALAALLIGATLMGCGATAVIDPQAIQTQAAAPTALPTLRVSEEDADAHALLWQLLAGQLLGATPETAAELLPENALDVGFLTLAQREELDALCEKQPGHFSVYLQDLRSGGVYTYGAGALYYPASTLKAPYALWLCRKADAGLIDLDGTVPNLLPGALEGDDLSTYSAADAVPARLALHAMIADSDNDATTLLAGAWPGDDSGFTDFLSELGFSNATACGITADGGIVGLTDVLDTASVMVELYNYFGSDAENAAFLQECFLGAEHEILYVPQSVPAAKKYGSWDYAYHDAVIVYAENPYVLCCMTDQGNTDEDFPAAPTAAMQALGKLAYQFLDE